MKTPIAIACASLLAAAQTARADEPPPRTEWYEGLSVRAGALYLLPLSSSSPVTLSGVAGPAALALSNGPIAGSGVSVGSAIMPALTLSYRVWDQIHVETILAPPISLKFQATGTLATQPLAKTALGNLPTGVPALGTDLGETKALPPVVTGTYHFLPGWRVDPYAGLGASLMISYDTQITNPVLTSVHPVSVSLPPKLGWVLQAGMDVRIWEKLFFTFDVKYIGGLDMDVAMNGLDVTVPNLPLYGSVHLGDATVHLSINPVVFQAGVGWNF